MGATHPREDGFDPRGLALFFVVFWKCAMQESNLRNNADAHETFLNHSLPKAPSKSFILVPDFYYLEGASMRNLQADDWRERNSIGFRRLAWK